MLEDNKKEIPNVPDLRFNYKNNWQRVKLGHILKIKSGMDQKKVQCSNGKYNIYGTGGIIGRTNTPLYSKESVGIGRKGTIDKPQYWSDDKGYHAESYSYEPSYMW